MFSLKFNILDIIQITYFCSENCAFSLILQLECIWKKKIERKRGKIGKRWGKEGKRRKRREKGGKGGEKEGKKEKKREKVGK